MVKFTEDISQPYWWIAVVFAGLILNVVSGYLREWLDRRSRHIGRYFEKRSKRRQKNVKDGADILDDSPLNRIDYLIRSVSSRLRALSGFYMATLVVLAGWYSSNLIIQFFTLIWGTISFNRALAWEFDANYMEDVITESNRRLKVNQDPNSSKNEDSANAQKSFP